MLLATKIINLHLMASNTANKHHKTAILFFYFFIERRSNLIKYTLEIFLLKTENLIIPKKIYEMQEFSRMILLIRL